MQYETAHVLSSVAFVPRATVVNMSYRVALERR
jgi:hypothetical protein